MLLNCVAGEDSWDSQDSTARRSINPKENQPWLLIGRTDTEAEAPILRPPDVKNWLIWKDPDAGKDWRQEEKGMTEDEMVGWHRRLNGHEFEQAPGVGDRQGSLACCSPWGHKESDMTEWLNWLTETQRWGSEEAGSSGHYQVAQVCQATRPESQCPVSYLTISNPWFPTLVCLPCVRAT